MYVSIYGNDIRGLDMGWALKKYVLEPIKENRGMKVGFFSKFFLWYNHFLGINKPCYSKKGLNESAKKFEPCQTAQADSGQIFLFTPFFFAFAKLSNSEELNHSYTMTSFDASGKQTF